MLVLPTPLKPFEEKEFDIRPCPQRRSNFNVKQSDTGIEIGWKKGRIVVPQSGRYPTAPPFITRIGDLQVNAGENPPADSGNKDSVLGQNGSAFMR